MLRLVPNINGDVMPKLTDLLHPNHPDYTGSEGRIIDKPITEAVQAKATKGKCCDFAPDRNDLPTYLRHMIGSHPTRTKKIKELRTELSDMVRKEWERVFGGPLKVDFVCVNPDKIKLLRSTMMVSDLVPMNFGMDPEPNMDPSRFRVIIEI
jgi:hypothetical protein